MTLRGYVVLQIVRKTLYFVVYATKYSVFYSSFTQFKIYRFEFDQLLTNSFPLRFFYIYLQRFILSGNIVVKIHFSAKPIGL